MYMKLLTHKHLCAISLHTMFKPLFSIYKMIRLNRRHHIQQTYNNTHRKNVNKQTRGLSLGSFSIGQPFSNSSDRKNCICSGSMSFSICIKMSTKSSLLTANNSTLVLHVTVALRRAPCIKASSLKIMYCL